jgi:hypothetical protein
MSKFYDFSIKQSKKNTASNKKYLNLTVQLNRKTESTIQKKYLFYLSGFDNDNDGRLDNSNKNLSKIGGQIKWFRDNIFNSYKSKFKKISDKSEKDIDEQQQRYFERRDKILSEFNIDTKDVYTKEFKAKLDKLSKNTAIQLNVTIDKWAKFYYDTLFRGITQQQKISKVLENLVTPSGHIRIGSSFAQSTEANIIMSQVARRTAFVQQDAKKQGLDVVWNANPMDRLTKPVCMHASLAGVITEQKMADEYGFPPRWICRCDPVYTRSEWTQINQGINEGIEERRIKLIDILTSDPSSFQKSKWLMSMGKGKRKRKIVPSDSKRAAGELFYSSVKDAIDLLKKETVPEYNIVQD